MGSGLKVTLLFYFGPKPKFCSFDFDLDQAEQFMKIVLQDIGQLCCSGRRPGLTIQNLLFSTCVTAINFFSY